MTLGNHGNWHKPILILEADKKPYEVGEVVFVYSAVFETLKNLLVEGRDVLSHRCSHKAIPFNSEADSTFSSQSDKPRHYASED
jgi:hypothetical protein